MSSRAFIFLSTLNVYCMHILYAQGDEFVHIFIICLSSENIAHNLALLQCVMKDFFSMSLNKPQHISETDMRIILEWGWRVVTACSFCRLLHSYKWPRRRRKRNLRREAVRSWKKGSLKMVILETEGKWNLSCSAGTADFLDSAPTLLTCDSSPVKHSQSIYIWCVFEVVEGKGT